MMARSHPKPSLLIDDLILEGEKLKLKAEQFLLEVKYGTVNVKGKSIS